MSIGHKVGFVGVLPISLKEMWRKKALRFGLKRERIDSIDEHVILFPSIPKLPYLNQLIHNFLGKHLLRKYFKMRGKPDILHLHVYAAGDIACWAQKHWNVPLVWTEHYSDAALNKLNDFEKTIVKKLCKRASVRIAVSSSLAAQLQSQYGKSFECIPNTYDSRKFSCSTAEPKDSFFFINVARIDRIKNHERLILAFAKEFKGNPMVRLKIIGGGDISDLQELVIKNNLSGRVLFLGEQKAEQIVREYKCSHAFVLSSDYETFCVSLIEALACGLPAVSTRCGGPEEILTSEELGVLVERDSDALATGMRYVFLNRSKYNRGEISRQIFERYSLEVVADKLTNLYQLCIG